MMWLCTPPSESKTDTDEGRNPFSLAVLYCMQKGFILEEIAILDLFGDTGQLLVYDAACTHVQMTYLRVTHLAFRKTYCHSACHVLLQRDTLPSVCP